MTLRVKINLIVVTLLLSFLAGVMAIELRAMRRAINEEVVAANQVASRLLQRTAFSRYTEGVPSMLAFLQGIGRVRSSDIILFDSMGEILYRSPASTYKPGRDAPDWFDRLVAPPASVQFITFPDGKLEMRSNASRAVVDAWDDTVALLTVSTVLAIVLGISLNWLVGRTVRPFATIVDGLNRIEAGRFETRLPALSGAEAASIGSAFNRMADRLETNLDSERRAIRAELQLSDSRVLARWIDRRIEAERRAIARELHDEFGQSVTALRSIALSIARRTEASDRASSEAARTIADETSRLYEAMRGIIPRLTPMVLDNLGLADALRDLVERSQRAHPQQRICLVGSPEALRLDPERSLALYRAAQEGLTNALRHGRPTEVTLALARLDDGTVELQVINDGLGPVAVGSGPGPGPGPSGTPGAAVDADHYGLRWLAERLAGFGGALTLAPRSGGGAVLTIRVPPAPPGADPATDDPATDDPATDLAGADVATTDVATTDLAATDVAATDVAATDLAATGADRARTDRDSDGPTPGEVSRS